MNCTKAWRNSEYLLGFVRKLLLMEQTEEENAGLRAHPIFSPAPQTLADRLQALQLTCQSNG